MSAARVEPRADDPERGHVVVDCPKNGTCTFGVWRRTPLEAGAQSAKTWNWQGPAEKPTIKPSIDCHGGCGRHFTIVDGELRR